LSIANRAGLGYCTDLQYLYHHATAISEISSIANLANPTLLCLQVNQIGDIGPLVQNEALGSRNSLWPDGDPLRSDSINIYIPQLQARGVTVVYQTPGS